MNSPKGWLCSYRWSSLQRNWTYIFFYNFTLEESIVWMVEEWGISPTYDAIQFIETDEQTAFLTSKRVIPVTTSRTRT